MIVMGIVRAHVIGQDAMDFVLVKLDWKMDEKLVKEQGKLKVVLLDFV